MSDFDPSKLSADDTAYIQETGEFVFGKNVAASIKNNEKKLSVTYVKTGFDSSDARPEYYYNCKDITNAVTLDAGGNVPHDADVYKRQAQLYGVSRTTKTAKTQSASRMSDQVSISQAGRDYQIAKKAVSEASDIREDKVALLKNMVDSGQYEVSGDDFASKLLERYNSL